MCRHLAITAVESLGRSSDSIHTGEPREAIVCWTIFIDSQLLFSAYQSAYPSSFEGARSSGFCAKTTSAGRRRLAQASHTLTDRPAPSACSPRRNNACPSVQSRIFPPAQDPRRSEQNGSRRPVPSRRCREADSSMPVRRNDRRSQSATCPTRPPPFDRLDACAPESLYGRAPTAQWCRNRSWRDRRTPPSWRHPLAPNSQSDRSRIDWRGPLPASAASDRALTTKPSTPNPRRESASRRPSSRAGAPP